MTRSVVRRFGRAAIFASLLLYDYVGAKAFAFRGEFTYPSARQCAAVGQIQPDRCEHAAANSTAEFEEKAPHFASRVACEGLFKACSIGFGGSGTAGIFFVPRQNGFKIRVRASDDMVVTPIGPGYFRSRSILKRDAAIDPKVGRQAREAFEAAQKRSATATTFGQTSPDPPVESGMLPVINNDPTFDCASVLEPTAKGDPNTGCYLAPARHR